MQLCAAKGSEHTLQVAIVELNEWHWHTLSLYSQKEAECDITFQWHLHHERHLGIQNAKEDKVHNTGTRVGM